MLIATAATCGSVPASLIYSPQECCLQHFATLKDQGKQLRETETRTSRDEPK
jgi:hypothetical protein